MRARIRIERNRSPTTVGPHRRTSRLGRVLDVRRVACSGLHAIEGDATLNDPGEVGLDAVDAGDSVNKGRGTHKVRTLHEFQSRWGKPETGGVERAVLVRDENHAREFVHFNKELEFVHDALLLEVRLLVACEACRPAGQRDAVIARKSQTILQEVVEVLTHATVGAVDGRGTYTSRVVLDHGDELHRKQSTRARKPGREVAAGRTL
jgi:hypothetical protein